MVLDAAGLPVTEESREEHANREFQRYRRAIIDRAELKRKIIEIVNPSPRVSTKFRCLGWRCKVIVSARSRTGLCRECYAASPKVVECRECGKPTRSLRSELCDACHYGKNPELNETIQEIQAKEKEKWKLEEEERARVCNRCRSRPKMKTIVYCKGCWKYVKEEVIGNGWKYKRG